MQLLTAQYQNVVVDVPHQLDAMGAGALGVARHVLVVLEQSVLHVKNASKLLRVLTKEIGVAPGRMRIILNRYSRRSNVTVEDIERALDFGKVTTCRTTISYHSDSIDTANPCSTWTKTRRCCAACSTCRRSHRHRHVPQRAGCWSVTREEMNMLNTVKKPQEAEAQTGCAARAERRWSANGSSGSTTGC